MSVTEVVRIASKKGKGDEFSERLARGLGVQSKDPNCVEITYQRQVEDPDQFLLHLVWTSIPAHDAWRAAHREEWRSHILDHIEGLPQLIVHYKIVGKVK